MIGWPSMNCQTATPANAKPTAIIASFKMQINMPVTSSYPVSPRAAYPPATQIRGRRNARPSVRSSAKLSIVANVEARRRAVEDDLLPVHFIGGHYVRELVCGSHCGIQS